MKKEKQNFEKWGRVNRDPSISHGLVHPKSNQNSFHNHFVLLSQLNPNVAFSFVVTIVAVWMCRQNYSEYSE